MAARLSVNLNKVALLRNSRGRGVPDLLAAADRTLRAGAHGITLHPRLDQRHVRFTDVPDMARFLARTWPGVELNVECEDHPDLMELVLAVAPAQVTLVPVTPGEVTSDHGWDLPRQGARLARSVRLLRDAGLRVSAFADPRADVMGRFADAGVHRVELYTGPYAWAEGAADVANELRALRDAAAAAVSAGLGVNAGHDLDAANVVALRDLPGLVELSIGHALAVRAWDVGYTVAIRELLDGMGVSPAPTPRS